MNGRKYATTLASCCVIILTVATQASADFVGVTTVIKDDPDTEFLCTQGHGDFVPGPLTVCNVFAVFDHPNDTLRGVGNADLQVFNGQNPDVFFQHPLNFNGSTSPECDSIPVFPDLICDSFVTIGYKCGPDPPGTDETILDISFDPREFQFNGHLVGYWSSGDPNNGQGDAGNYPDLQVLFLQSSVLIGLSMSGDIDIFWREHIDGQTIAEVDVAVECAAVCPDDYPCDDGDACTEDDVCNNQVCEGTPVDCSDLDDQCNYGVCNPDTGMCEQVSVPDGWPADDGNVCTEGDMCVDGAPSGTPVQCPEGQVCDPATGECVVEQDPCECVNGRVTLCHIPPGNLANARTITVGCAARDRHLVHGDVCGPCEDGDGLISMPMRASDIILD